MNERGDVRGYLRVAVQAVLGREEETVNSFYFEPLIMSLIIPCQGGLPIGCPTVCQDSLPGLLCWSD